MGTRTVLSVLGQDRSGIVARIATTLADAGANIDDIRQTLLGDLFSMTMLVTVNEDLCSFEDLQARLTEDAETLGMQITLQREDVFRFMYEV
ncbi:MAG: ACT domain-containing protein [Actinobacteria bacterium]|nr:ACT domain-containing protein [Actinomycetota bacterium]